MNITPATTNFTEEPECYPINELRHVFFILHLVVILVGIPSNVFSLIVSCQHIKQNNELGVYLFNLALSDLCFIAGLPVWMDFTYNNSWRHGSTLCTVCVYFLFINYYTSALLLSCIAIDRYFGVVHPLKFAFFRTPSTATTVSIVVWILALIFNAITISPNNIYDDDAEVCLDIFPLSPAQKRVMVARFTVGFLLPAVVIVFCYCRICVEISSNKAMSLPERKRAFRLLGSVLLTLCICFGPIHISMVLRAFLEDCEPPTWLYILYKFGGALSTLNCLADPLLYCFITRTGRTWFTQVFMRFQR